MASQLGLVKVLSLPETFCFTGTAGDILIQIANALAVDLPDSISNVIVSASEPVDTQNTAIWVRTDNSGTFIDLYVVSVGQWVSLNEWKTWTPFYDGTGSMTYTLVTTYSANYVRQGDMVTFNISAEGTTGGVADDALVFTLPFPRFAETDHTVFAGTSYNATGNHRATSIRTGDGSQSQVYVYTFDNSVWGLGANRAFRANGTYKAA